MRRLRYLPLPPLLLSLLLPVSAFAAPWTEDKAFFTEAANAPSSKVDAADLNGDGYIDLVFANGGGFDKGDDTSDFPQQAFFYDSIDKKMTDFSAMVFGPTPLVGRAVKLRDLDYDGDNDIILGTTWESQSQLFLNDGAGNFSNETATNLPQDKNSVGDIEVGDVDGDGDLDMILTDWGGDTPVSISSGGVTLLWTQMGDPAKFGDAGTGMFEDSTAKMPNVNVRWSFEAEFVDVNNDYNLDILVSAYAGDKTSLYLFANDGAGNFSDMTAGNIPQGRNALDVEAIDLNGDKFLDLVMLHDSLSLGRNRVLLNDKNGGFMDQTGLIWPMLENPASLDYMAAFYDYDSNGVVDFLVGALQTAQNKYPDRLLKNQAAKGQPAKFKSDPTAFTEIKASAGTYAIVLADLNKDDRLDVVMAQNENAVEKKVYLATEEVPVDKAAPIFVNYELLPDPLEYPGEAMIHVRCHDNKSPLMLHDFTQDAGFPYIEWWKSLPADLEATPGEKSDPGQWYGEYLWRINFVVPDTDALFYRICAIDAAGNKACTPVEEHPGVTGGTETESDTNNSDSMTETESNSNTNTDSNTDSNTDGTDSQVSATVTNSDSMTETDSQSNATNTDSNATPGTVSDSMTETDTKATASDSVSDTEPTESFTATMSDSQNTMTATVTDSESDSISDTAIDSSDLLDDDGCGCDADNSPAGGVLSSLALLGLLGLRRRRRA